MFALLLSLSYISGLTGASSYKFPSHHSFANPGELASDYAQYVIHNLYFAIRLQQ